MTDADLVHRAESNSSVRTSLSAQAGGYLSAGPILKMVQEYRTDETECSQMRGTHAKMAHQNSEFKNTTRLEACFESRMNSAKPDGLDKEEFFQIVAKMNSELPFAATLTDYMRPYKMLMKAFYLRHSKRDMESLEVGLLIVSAQLRIQCVAAACPTTVNRRAVQTRIPVG